VTKTILHVGCGREPLPAWMEGYDEEVRLDIDADVEPDVVASMTDLGDIGPFDAIYTCHTLEHVFPQEVPVALAEFRRVLKPGGIAMIVVPDLEDVKATDEMLYESPAGPVSGLDMIYGMPGLIALSPHMAHRCGFVADTLRAALEAAGFAAVLTQRSEGYNLFGVARA
jgi:SAM-dependent methyltransferase